LHAQGAILDFGCGHRPLQPWYETYASSIIGVDWISDVADIHSDLNSQMPFQPGVFDTILASDVLEHLKSPVEAVRECARVLAIGGHIIIGTPFYYPIHEEPHDYWRLTEFCYRYIAVECGLELVSVRAQGGSFDILADLVLKHTSVCGPIFSISSAIIQGLSRLAVVRRLDGQTQSRFPLGYIVVMKKTDRSETTV
jgi:SAM-dependent methyltransferase